MPRLSGGLRCAFIIIVLIALGVPVWAGNTLANPGFESGSLSPWFQDQSLSDGMDWAVTTSDAHSGLFSAMDSGNKHLRQNFSAISDSRITEVSFWLRHPWPVTNPSFPSEVAVDFFYSNSTQAEFVLDTPTTDWTFYNVTSHLSPTRSLIGIGIWGYTDFSDGPNQPPTFLDDLNVVEVPEPACCAIAGVTFVLGFLLRRRPVTDS